MKKLITLLLAVCMLVSLGACSQKYELKALALTDDMLDISAMGELENIFTSENRAKLVSLEPEFKEYYSEYHDYANNIHTREDYTLLMLYSQVFADDPNFYIEKTYAADQADGRICQIGLACQVQIPNGDYTEEELMSVAKESMNISAEKFRSAFGLSEDKLYYDLPALSETDESFIWMDDEYKYSYNCRYVGGEKGDNDLCRITFTISSMEFLRKYHDDI